MSKNHTISQVMTSKIFSLNDNATIADAHNLSKEKGIRHIPVVDNDNTLIGMVTQKQLLNKVLNMLSLYSAQECERIEKQNSIKEIMDSDCLTVPPNKDLLQVISLFANNRHGCLPVVDEGKKLLGIVTSADFVRYCEKLLLNPS